MQGKLSVCVTAMLILALCIGCRNNSHVKKTAEVAQHAAEVADTTDVFNEYYVHDSADQNNQGSIHSGKFVVQVACVASRHLAGRVVKELSEHSLSSYVVRVENPVESLTGTYYRVRIGGFSTVPEAQEFAEKQLVAYGFPYWVDRKKHDTVGAGSGGLGGQDNRAYFE